jgi:hypothetical protein
VPVRGRICCTPMLELPLADASIRRS